MNLKGKVVMITGASSGIGMEVSKILAQKGAGLALLGRNTEKLDALALDFGKSGVEAIAIKTDVTSRDDIRKAVEETLKKFSRIDVVVNDAGVGHYGPLEALDMAEFEKMLRTNIFGPLYMIQETVKYLKKSKGIIMNISSGLSKRGLPYLSAYGSTKAMLNQISDGLRMELMGEGVKVLTYNPPATDTPFIKGHNVTMKLAKPAEVASRIVKAIEKETREASEGAMRAFMAAMNFFAPQLLDRIFYNAMVKKK
jgi:short-subunit dehydrogenase